MRFMLVFIFLGSTVVVVVHAIILRFWRFWHVGRLRRS